MNRLLPLVAALLIHVPIARAGYESAYKWDALVGGWQHSETGAFFGGHGMNDVFTELFLPLGGSFALYGNGDGDPWLNLHGEIHNGSEQSIYFFVNFLLSTDSTVGPTTQDSFIQLALEDTNGDGIAYLNSPFANFTAIDDHGGDITQGVGIAWTQPYTSYAEAGEFVVFDTQGPQPGPDSSLLDASLGFDVLRFTASGYLSAGDTLKFDAFACYANDFGMCPERFIYQPVPEVEIAYLMLSGLALLGAVSRRRRNARA